MRKFLGRSRARLLYVEALEDLDDKPKRPRPPNRFRATIYDDTNHRTVLADGSLDDLRRADADRIGGTAAAIGCGVRRRCEARPS